VVQLIDQDIVNVMIASHNKALPCYVLDCGFQVVQTVNEEGALREVWYVMDIFYNIASYSLVVMDL